MTILLESQESSSPIITKAVSNSLISIPVNNYHFSLIEKMALRMIGRFPKEVAEWLIPRVNSTKAFSNKAVERLSTRDLVNARIDDYQQLEGKFPAITVGIGMGGTTAHLALMLGGPFLPQSFVVTLQNGTMTGDVNQYCALTLKTSKAITDRNPDLMTIQHYDPVHDGWLVKRVNHLRLKLIDLPEEYKKFLLEKLVPGGDMVYLEGKATWKRFRLAEKCIFQIGGWGDIPADEFIYGSERLDEFARKEKLEHSHWNLDGYPLEEGPESEWGSEPGLGEALQNFCQKHGFNFIKISFDDPNDFSRLAFFAKKSIIEKSGLKSQGVVVETFSQFDTSIVDHYALLPLWLIFNTKDSNRFLKSMVQHFPTDVPVFFSGLSTFSTTPDLVSWEEWDKTFSGCDLINIGARKTHYPADALALVDWKKPLEEWAQKNRSIIDTSISAIELTHIAKTLQHQSLES